MTNKPGMFETKKDFLKVILGIMELYLIVMAAGIIGWLIIEGLVKR
jgi:hypothetical protein